MRRLDGGDELSRGLVGFWPLDEGAGQSITDLSRLGNDGRGVNAPTWGMGRWGKAAVFSGPNGASTQNYNVGAKSIIGNLQVPLSISAWIYPVSSSGFQPIIAQYGAFSAGTLIKMLRTDTGTLKYYCTSNSGTFQAVGTLVPSLNAWSFVSVVVMGDLSTPTIRIRLNASTETPTLVALRSSITATITTRIGSNENSMSHSGNEGFNGRLQNIRIWNRALTRADEMRLWRDPWAGTLRDPRRVWYLPSGTAITGSGAITFADMAVDGTGVEEIPGSGAITFGAMTTAGSGELGLSGSGALTFAPMTTAGNGTLAFVGSGAITFGAMATSGAGLLGIAGAGALTFAPMGVSGSGAVAVAGSGVLTFAPMTVSGVGYLPITGAGALTFGPMTIAGVGAVSTTLIEGRGAIVFDAMSISGVGLNSAPGPTPAPAPVRRRPALSAIPLPTTPWVIPLTGNLTPVAYQFLFTLMRRTGGQPGKTTPDDQDALPLASLLEGGGEWANVSQRFEFAGDTQTQTLVSLAETERLDASSVQVVLSDGQVEPPAQIVILGVEGGAITDAALLPIATPQSAPLPDVLTPGASPWTFDAPGKGFVLVEGGTVSAITISRDGTTNYATGMTGGFFPVDWQDQLTVTYTVAPNVTFFGSSYDA